MAPRSKPSNNNAKGKAKSKAAVPDPHPFRYRSFNDRLAAIRIDASRSARSHALAGLDGQGSMAAAAAAAASSSATVTQHSVNDDDDDDDDDDTDQQAALLHAKTAFGLALNAWRELNLSLPFTSFAQQAAPLCLSLPLLLHHLPRLATLLANLLTSSAPDAHLAYAAALDLVPRLAVDASSEFMLVYPVLLEATLHAATVGRSQCGGDERQAASIVEQAFESAAATLKAVAPLLLRGEQGTQGLASTWYIMRPYLGWSAPKHATEQQQQHTMEEEEEEEEQEEAEEDELQRQEEAATAAAGVLHKRAGRRVPPHTRRFASEALAHLVRRAQPGQLQSLASLMFSDVAELHGSDLTRGAAGVWVEVLKSSEHRLHSAAPAQLKVLLRAPASTQASRQARTQIGYFVLTALVHHSQASALEPIISLVLDFAVDALNAVVANVVKASLASIEDLSELLQWLCALIGTRKGARVSDSAKASLFVMLPRCAALVVELSVLQASPGDASLAHSELTRNLVTLTALALPTGRIQDLVGAGIKCIDGLATMSSSVPSPAFCAVVVALGRPSLGWSGFAEFVLPSVIRSTADTLASTANQVAEGTVVVLGLLAELHAQGQLSHLARTAPTPLVARWQKAVGGAVQHQLRSFASVMEQDVAVKADDEKLPGYVAALRLAPLFPSLAKENSESLRRAITSLLRAAVSAEVLQRSYEASPVNVASLLAAALQSLCGLAQGAKDSPTAAALLQATMADLHSFDAIERFNSHRLVLPALSELFVTQAQSGSVRHDALPTLASLASALRESLASSDDALRLAAAELLALPFATQSSAAALLARIVEIERTPLAVETVRDRNVRVRALARELLNVSVASPDDAALPVVRELVVLYLVGTLKLNLRPMWEESRAALVDLAARFGEDVWSVAFAELREACPVVGEPSTWSTFSNALDEAQPSGEVLGEKGEAMEKEFSDPQLAVRKTAIQHSLRSAYGSAEARGAAVVRDLAASQRPQGRLDVINYVSQILKLFASQSSLAERHNAQLVEHFFATVAKAAPVDAEEDEVEAHAAVQEEPDAVQRLSLPERRARLAAYLELFSHFSNPKALSRSAELYDYFLSLCAMGDVKVQRLALDCVMTWRHPSQLPYAQQLRTLLEVSRFRDELTALDLSVGSDVIQPAHRGELLPLLLRLLFGLMVSRRGRSSSGAGQAGRKTAILAALSGCEAAELKTLVELMLAPFDDQQPLFDAANGHFVLSSQASSASVRRQAGFVSLLADVIKHLGLVLLPYWPQLLGTVLNLGHHASVTASAGQGKATIGARSLRQATIRRVADFFKQPTEAFAWQPFLPTLFGSFVTPRLALLSSESIQSTSALLDLFHVWTGRVGTMPLLVRYDDSLLPSVYSCLAAPTVKPPVVAQILDMLERFLDVIGTSPDDDGAAVRDAIIRPHISQLLAGITPLVRRLGSAGGVDRARDELLRRQIHILAGVGSYVTSAQDAATLLELLGPMMRKNNHVIPERTKTDLLQIFCDLLLLSPAFQDPASETFTHHYELFSGAFGMLRSRSARISLSSLFGQFARIDSSLVRVAGWLDALNSFSVKRMDEPDFDRRLAAFDALNDEREPPSPALSPQEWLPLVHNMLFLVQDSEELAFRTNAGLTLRCFIKATASATDASVRQEMHSIFRTAVYPGLRRCLRSRSELVRRELLSVLGTAVLHLPEFESLGEMRGLLADGDEEANFFNNIHHVQTHRRARALRRLAKEADAGVLRSRTIAEIFAPLITHFLQQGANGELTDHNLVNETIACLGRLALQLQWGAYNALLWRFLKLANEASAAQKVFVRAAMSLLDSFHFAMDAQALTDASEVAELEAEEQAEATNGDNEQQQPEAVATTPATADADDELQQREAVKAAAQSVKVLDAVTARLLPALMGYLAQKDEADDAVRLPVAVGVVRVVQCLPPNVKQAHINRLLTTLSNVLKSKSQETRDLARETFCKVATALGKDHFPAMVRELRRALTRGPQLAVLAFTVHSLLVHLMAATEDPLVVLDAGADDVVHVATEDIFGHTSEDRASIENRTKMREVRQCKSLDTFEQLAKIVSPSRTSALLLPLRDIMEQTEAHKAIVAVEDVLRRIASGLNSNQHFDAATFLTLCHTLVSRNAVFLQPRKPAADGSQGKSLLGYQFALHMKRKDVEAGLGKQDHYSRNAHRFVVFGLDLLIVAMRRARFDFHDDNVLARLDPLVSAVGNTLFASNATVVNAGLKGTAALVKCPLPSLEKALPVYVKQILSAIHREGSAQSDIAQTALKALTTVLRECKAAQFKERQLADLLTLVVVDIEEPGTQSAIFGLLRAIIARRFVVPEVYDVMDKVAEMLVTNQSAQVREVCRSAFLAFLLDYPQGKGRLRNQMHFLAKNVSYTFESGRLSVLELLSAVLAKFEDTVLHDYADLLFVAFVMVLANDDSSACREKAASLVKTLIALVAEDHRDKLIVLTHNWAEQAEQAELTRVALQVFGLVLEAAPSSLATWGERAIASASNTLEAAAVALRDLEYEDDDGMDVDLVDWRLPYQALQILSKLHAKDAQLLDRRAAAVTWSRVRELLLFPHAWVRLAACRLLGSLYAVTAIARPVEADAMQDPLGLSAFVDTSKKLVLQLQSAHVDEALGLQIVKNLLYIGRCFALAPAPAATSDDIAAQPSADDEDADDSEEEGDAGDDEQDGNVANPLAWLFTKLSYLARGAQLVRADMKPQIERAASVLRWFAAMATHLDGERIESFLPHIIGPIFRIVDDDALKGPKLEELKALATEVSELIQARVGTTKWASVYSSVQRRAIEKRRERKTARLMQGINNPEAAMRRKASHNAKAHASRKRKSNAFAETKLRTRPLKRHQA